MFIRIFIIQKFSFSTSVMHPVPAEFNSNPDPTNQSRRSLFAGSVVFDHGWNSRNRMGHPCCTSMIPCLPQRSLGLDGMCDFCALQILYKSHTVTSHHHNTPESVSRGELHTAPLDSACDPRMLDTGFSEPS